MVTEGSKKIEIVRGELTHKEEKLSSGKKTYWLLEIAGVGKASCWDKKIADGLQIGKSLEFETEYDGQFRTVKSVKEPIPPKAMTQSVPALVPVEHQVGYIPALKDNQAIMAQVALKSAVERANGIQSYEATTAGIIEMGQQFFIAMRAWAIGKLVTPVMSPSPEPVKVSVERPTPVPGSQPQSSPGAADYAELLGFNATTPPGISLARLADVKAEIKTDADLQFALKSCGVKNLEDLTAGQATSVIAQLKARKSSKL